MENSASSESEDCSCCLRRGMKRRDASSESEDLSCCLCLMWNEKKGHLENMDNCASKVNINCHAVCDLCGTKRRDI